MEKLSRVPSEMLNQVADDVEKIVAKGISFDMCHWITRKGVNDVCTVCLAGAVMVERYDITDNGSNPLDLFNRGKVSLYEARCLNLLDRMRRGGGFYDRSALMELNRDAVVTAFHATFDYLPSPEFLSRVSERRSVNTFHHDSYETRDLIKMLRDCAAISRTEGDKCTRAHGSRFN